MAMRPSALLTDYGFSRFKRTGKRNDIFLATKFGFMPDYTISGKPENVRSSAEKSLSRLGVDYIDLYYLHVGSLAFYVDIKLTRIRQRADSKTPIEVLPL